MKIILTLALMLSCAAPCAPVQARPDFFAGERAARSETARRPTDAPAADGADNTQRRRRKRVRRAGKSSKSMTQKDSSTPAEIVPSMDTPNRLEIDPGDIPPSERSRNPNEDQRTKIPHEISPDDMAPRPPSTPRKKRP